MKSAYEIFELVSDIHSKQEDLEEGDLYERILYADTYELTTVCPQLLEQEWNISNELVDKYCLMDPSKCPPVVIIKYSDDIYSIIDGSHRIEAFKKLGITSIPAYVGIIKKD